MNSSKMFDAMAQIDERLIDRSIKRKSSVINDAGGESSNMHNYTLRKVLPVAVSFVLIAAVSVTAVMIAYFSSNTLKQNTIYVTNTDAMGGNTVNGDLFKSFNRFPQNDSADFPKTRVIKLPDGTETEGEKTSLSLPGKGYLPFAVYKVQSLNSFVTISEDGTVAGIEKYEPVFESGTTDEIMPDDELIKKAKDHFRSFFGKDVPEGCDVSFFWDYTEQGQKCRANVRFNKESEGYRWASGISIAMTASGELLKVIDKMQFLADKNIPSGFADDIERQIKNWIKDKTVEFSMSQKELLLSDDGTLLARTFVELKPTDGDSFGLMVIIPLE